MTNAYLVLANGALFAGTAIGATKEVYGEVVFTTGMTGYLETLTDPSYAGQLVAQTFPLIGNYGTIEADLESARVGAAAYIVHELCAHPSNFRNEGPLEDFLKKHDIPGICGIDVRALTKMIREKGVMNGVLTSDPARVDLARLQGYEVKGVVADRSTRVAVSLPKNKKSKYKVALLDYGYKENIRRELVARGCDVTVLPQDSKAAAILSGGYDGIMLSNGPGDPAENVNVIRELKTLVASGIPLFGICLGHQLVALSQGFSTQKLKYGHRGANQPVKCLTDGRVYITSQNHGYAVVNESIDTAAADLLYINNNDGTCEGIAYKNAPVFTVQFHPEACGGPKDTGFLFDRFMSMMAKKPAARRK
ncbi:MAG: carbamoyl phosphate synthase small subunit [Clostridiales bacterium]|jgi:carbamoyl-phosphate synthase small subunit|nr:carbamoyl phosphate synthase small subunit [Clostridiales bacterium]